MNQTLEDIKHYYGEVLQSKDDLKTSACCAIDALSPQLKELMGQLEPEILERFYGCGAPLPPALEGCTVLDLGCGSGRDVYLLSKLVGETGRVIGVDMTAEQLSIARKYIDVQTKRFGYSTPNVDFREGYIEDLAAVDLADNSVDLVVSNCVLNLSPDKQRVFSEIFRVLKPGGELYFSDVFANRRVPEALVFDPVLRGECLGGAMYTHDFRRLLRSLGCLDYRIITSSPIELRDPEIEAKAGMIGFTSITIRAFKLESLEDICEDYGQFATYHGSIPHHPHTFHLDDHHPFEKGRPLAVCGNTAAMLNETRYAPHFTITGDRSTHFGAFDCEPTTTTNTDASCC